MQANRIAALVTSLECTTINSKLDELISKSSNRSDGTRSAIAVNEVMLSRFGAKTSFKVVAQLLQNYYMDNNCVKFEQLLNEFMSKNFKMNKEIHAQLIELQINAKQPMRALDSYANARQQYVMPKFCLYGDLPLKLTQQLIESDHVTEAVDFLHTNRFAIKSKYANGYAERILFALFKQYRTSDEPGKVLDLWRKLNNANAIPNDEFTKQTRSYLKTYNIDLPMKVELEALT